jgi:uncharacterized protein YndB with AHSA1/START domain
MPTSSITVRRLLKAKRERVFHAWTRPDLMARWFFPGDGWVAAVTSDLKVGGRYEVMMRDTSGGQHTQFGRYREIVAVSRLVFTWCCPDLDVVDSVVSIDLADQGDRTELILTHELPPDPKILRGHDEGWQGCLGNLEKMLSNDQEGRDS